MQQEAIKTAQEAATAAAAAGWFKLAHVLGVIAYAGGVLFTAKMMGSLVKLDPPIRAGAAAAARKAYLGVAMPGLLLLLGTGLYTAILDTEGKGYFKQGYFHIKLLAAFLVLIVDHMLVMKPLKALTREDMNTEGQEGLYKAGFWMTSLLLLVVLLALFVVRK
jgi:uncharacterized membrane protein